MRSSAAGLVDEVTAGGVGVDAETGAGARVGAD